MKFVTGAMPYTSSARDVAGIVAVRVQLRDPPIAVVDLQLGLGIALISRQR